MSHVENTQNFKFNFINKKIRYNIYYYVIHLLILLGWASYFPGPIKLQVDKEGSDLPENLY